MHLKTQATLVGLIGHHIEASLAPEIHMGEGYRQGLRYAYRLLDLSVLGVSIDELDTFLCLTSKVGFDGLAVTHPFKQSVVPLMDELSDEADALCAVNTIVFQDGRRVGHNTDWYGFYEAFGVHLPNVDRERVVQLGAGGAGGAVAYAGIRRGIKELVLFDLDVERASRVAAELMKTSGIAKVRVGLDLEAEIANASGLINASPVGMASLPGSPVPEKFLRPDLWVADIIYFPWETQLLNRARGLGAHTMNGGTMAVYQAAKQFLLFTGREPGIPEMLDRLQLLSAQRA
ncbi:shikimate dehydrogenase [Mesorhizobium australafricanum]|uniref:Shikimate dehydrogenase n=1 Tax=Mesorhizobium australafricanum TaxID=3072311 RepID=A0ABU4WY96_9HYPH|nr:shikimate dehydrogenase [Mesorhizobium sp. VK3E]MDX8440228.1 shikimate dehydrogenase [Mesorhizobium sp. VK3E]